MTEAGLTPTVVFEVVHEDMSVGAKELIEWLSKNLGSYKKLGRVTICTEAMLKSPVGKVRRKDLREPFMASIDRRVSRR